MENESGPGLNYYRGVDLRECPREVLVKIIQELRDEVDMFKRYIKASRIPQVSANPYM